MLSKEEIQKAEQLRKAGYSSEAALRILRPSVTDEPTKPSFFADVTGDIRETGAALGRTFRETQEKQEAAIAASTELRPDGTFEQSAARGFGQAVGIGAGGIARGLGDIFIGAGKAVLPQRTEEAIARGAQRVIEPIMETEAAQETMKWVEGLDPVTKRDLEAVLGVTDLATMFIGGAAAKQAAGRGISRVREAAKGVGERVGREITDVTEDFKSIFRKADDAGFETPDILKVKTPEQYRESALGAAAELLQSESKKVAKGRQAKYNNADIQAMRVIRDTDVPLKSQQDLADLFDTKVSEYSVAREKALKPFINNDVDDSFLSVIKKEALDLQKSGELPTANAYAKVVADETARFAKSAKASKGGVAKTRYLDERVKEINKKVTKLYDEVGGKENLLPEQKLEVQALDLIRKGLKNQLDDIAGEAYADLGTRMSGLIDARQFARIQRSRAKNAMKDVPWDSMNMKERAAFLQEQLPWLKDIGTGRLVKLDTKSDVLDAMVDAKVRQIRLHGKKGATGAAAKDVLPGDQTPESPKGEIKQPELDKRPQSQKELKSSESLPNDTTKTPPKESFAVAAGVSTDEEGNLTFDPMHAVIGVAGVTALKSGMSKKVVGQLNKIKDELRNVSKDLGAGIIIRSDDTVADLADVVARERFDIPKLKKVSFGGSDRDVYEIGDEYVLKVAKSSRGLAQNNMADWYAADAGIIPQIKEIGRNYVVFEKVSPPDANTKKMVKDLKKKWDSSGAPGKYSKDWYKVREDMRGIMEKYDYPGEELANFGDVLWGDMVSVRNWGTKNGKPIMLDEGSLNGDFVLEFINSAQKGIKNLDDPEFREIYNISKDLRKKFGDLDGKTMYGITGLFLPTVASQAVNQE